MEFDRTRALERIRAGRTKTAEFLRALAADLELAECDADAAEALVQMAPILEALERASQQLPLVFRRVDMRAVTTDSTDEGR